MHCKLKWFCCFHFVYQLFSSPLLKISRGNPHTHEEMEQMKRKATQRKAVLDATTTEEDAKAIAKQLELSTANANKMIYPKCHWILEVLQCLIF